MDDDSLDNPARLTHPVARDPEHRRRNEEQVELLRKAHARWRHALHIEEALRRAGVSARQTRATAREGAELPTSWVVAVCSVDPESPAVGRLGEG
jgi:hypothetical protein